MKEAPKASQSRTPGSFFKTQPFSASFPESFHAFDNNHTTIRSHPPSFPFPPSAHRPIFPKPKAQSLPAPFRTKCIFPPWYPRKPRFFSPQTSGFCTKCTITTPAKGSPANPRQQLTLLKFTGRHPSRGDKPATSNFQLSYFLI